MNELRGEPSTPDDLGKSKPIRCYSILAAAGRSRRMGQPKLLLPWNETTVIDHVLQSWTSSRVSETIIVIRKDDDRLYDACRRHSVQVLMPPTDPVDMKASFLFGSSLIVGDRPDWCFLSPADLPTISKSIINRMYNHASTVADESVIVPCFGKKQGHPVMLRPPAIENLSKLPSDQGLNSLVDQLPNSRVYFTKNERVEDIDTPQEYRSLRERFRGS